VALVDLDEAVYGLVGGRARNTLVFNFWSVLFGLLVNGDSGTVDTGGNSRLIRTSADANYSAGCVVFGTGSSMPDFSQYKLDGRNTALEGTTISPTMTVEADKVRVRWGRVSAGALSEVGLYAYLYDTGGTSREIMMGRALLSVPGSGYNVYYDVIVKAPFVKNLASLILGLVNNSDQNVVNRAGATVAARTSGDVNAAAMYPYVGTSNAPFSPNDYELTNPLTLYSTTYYTYSSLSWAMVIVTGAARLASDMSIGEVGVAQPIYSSAGALMDVLWLRIPLSTPISKGAGDVFSTVITFYAGR
jgi:hypothetical protein